MQQTAEQQTTERIRPTRKYEIMFLLNSRPEIAAEDLQFIRSLFQDLGLNVLREKELGVKQLAYPVKKQERGTYHLFYVEGQTPKIQKMASELKLRESILRYINLELETHEFEYLLKKEQEDEKKSAEAQEQENSFSATPSPTSSSSQEDTLNEDLEKYRKRITSDDEEEKDEETKNLSSSKKTEDKE